MISGKFPHSLEVNLNISAQPSSRLATAVGQVGLVVTLNTILAAIDNLVQALTCGESRSHQLPSGCDIAMVDVPSGNLLHRKTIGRPIGKWWLHGI